ncbi:MAG TPA: hypothetical protein VK604_07110, partial [Bryobacteraceae bacterium]|nr:hypothetical protein [Bryobacteraceae bacterium]
STHTDSAFQKLTPAASRTDYGAGEAAHVNVGPYLRLAAACKDSPSAVSAFDVRFSEVPESRPPANPPVVRLEERSPCSLPLIGYDAPRLTQSEHCPAGDCGWRTSHPGPFAVEDVYRLRSRQRGAGL